MKEKKLISINVAVEPIYDFDSGCDVMHPKISFFYGDLCIGTIIFNDFEELCNLRNEVATFLMNHSYFEKLK